MAITPFNISVPHSTLEDLRNNEPHNVAVGLNDSPAGLAAWIVPRYKN